MDLPCPCNANDSRTLPLLFLYSQSAVESKGLKGSRNLQFGGLSVSTATTTGDANSIGSLQPGVFLPMAPSTGANGEGSTVGTSFGTSSSNSPGFGNSLTQGAANGAGNATSLVVGGLTEGGLDKNAGDEDTALPEAIFGNGFTDFASSGGGVGSFGSPLGLPGGGGVAGLQTGGGGGGFGFTLGGGVGNVTNVDLGYTQAYGTAQTSGFGSGQGQSLFGQAGGNGGGTSTGTGGGALKPVLGAGLTTTLFNGTGGGLASGGAGGYVGFNPNTPVILGAFPIGP